MQYPNIGVFDADAPIGLRQLPNGGWVVSQPGKMGSAHDEIGAYTTAQEMLDALAEALLHDDETPDVAPEEA